jgi:hypothetical protein
VASRSRKNPENRFSPTDSKGTQLSRHLAVSPERLIVNFLNRRIINSVA